MKTKAAILFKQKNDLEVCEIEIPKLNNGQVLVRILSSRICGSQIGEINGVKGKDKHLPHLLGHEAVGIVEDVGQNITKVKKYDKVILSWIKGSGINSKPPTYKLYDKNIYAGYVTTFSEYSVISENRLTKIDSKVSNDLAVLCADVLPTGFNSFSKILNFNIGDNVLVIGSGGMGLGGVLGAYLSGANKICVIDKHDFKLKNSKKYGANQFYKINSKKSIHENIKLFRKKNDTYYDHVIDYSGNNSSIELSLNFTKIKASLLIIGVMNFKNKLKFNTQILNYGLNIYGSSGSNSNPDIDFQKIIDLVNSRKISINNFFSHEDKLENINKLIKLHISGKVINSKLNINNS